MKLPNADNTVIEQGLAQASRLGCRKGVMNTTDTVAIPTGLPVSETVNRRQAGTRASHSASRRHCALLPVNRFTVEPRSFTFLPRVALM
jgi:hypothetical protein